MIKIIAYRHFRYLPVLVMTMAVACGVLSCRSVNHKLGIVETIKNPVSGTPEWVMQQAMAAAVNPDVMAGWNEILKVIHSEEKASPARMNEWREYGYRYMRVAVPGMLVDKTAVTYRLVDRRENERDLIMIVERPGTVQGTDSCQLRHDKEAGGQWRLFGRCFGW